MTRNTCWWFLSIVTLVSVGAASGAGEPTKKNATPAAKTEAVPEKKGEKSVKGEKGGKSESTAAPATYSVKKKPFRIAIDLDGTFEAQTAREIFVKPEEWNTLTVESAAAHGAHVREGDVLLTLDTEKLDRTIADLRTDIKLSDIGLQQATDQLKSLEKTTPIDLEATERASRIAKEDQKRFLDVERPFALKAADFNLKVAGDMLEYEQEELRQLEKMYKADDITEETEQIVLKRARDTVERAKFMVAYAKLNRDQSVKFSLPRMANTVTESAERKSLDWERRKIELPLAVQKQRLELDKLRTQRERQDDKLKKLVADRELMTVKSPIDGVVYYGKCVRGRFSDSSNMADNLRRNGSIMSNQVVMTVVQPRPMFIRATVPEEQLRWLRPGLKGVATPTGFRELKLSATVDDVSDIAVSPGSFDAKFSVALDRKGKLLMPGMTCKVRLIPYLRKEAITVPPKAVIADELDDQQQFVYVVEKDGKPKKVAVTLGEKTDKQVEILKGLTAGEKVLLEAPKED